MTTERAIGKNLRNKKGVLTAKEPNSIVDKLDKALKGIENFFAKRHLERCISGLLKSLSRLFAGAILLVVLASLAPELRVQVPSLYVFVDWLLEILESLYRMVCTFLHLY